MLTLLKEKYTCMQSFEENIHILLRRKQWGSMKLLTKHAHYLQLSWKNNSSHSLNIICIENLLKILVSSSELAAHAAASFHYFMLPYEHSSSLKVFIINMKINALRAFLISKSLHH
jgi:hypothetical protein